MSFADFVWSRRADWADGRSAFRPASTRCSRPLASTGSLGMSQLISCVFCRLRVSCGGKIAIRVSGRGASHVVDEWNSKTVTRPWRGCAKKCRLPGHDLVKEKKRYEGMQKAPLTSYLQARNITHIRRCHRNDLASATVQDDLAHRCCETNHLARTDLRRKRERIRISHDFN